MTKLLLLRYYGHENKKNWLEKFNSAMRTIYAFWFGIFLGYLSSRVIMIFNIVPKHRELFMDTMDLADKLLAKEYTAVFVYTLINEKYLQPPQASGVKAEISI